MKFSIHNHTKEHSNCASISPIDLVDTTASLGFGGLALTEHDYRWSNEEIKDLYERCVRQKHCPKDFILISGEEVSINGKNAQSYHALVLGNYRKISEDLTLEGLCAHVHSTKGIIVLAHPLRPNNVIPEFWNYDADGIEVLHPDQKPWDIVREILDKQGKKFAEFGSSDVHRNEHMFSYWTEFPDSVKTEADILEAIRERKISAKGGYEPKERAASKTF